MIHAEEDTTSRRPEFSTDSGQFCFLVWSSEVKDPSAQPYCARKSLTAKMLPPATVAANPGPQILATALNLARSSS